MKVSHDYSLPLYDVFTNSFISNIDSLCKQNLKSSKADSILFFIGRKGAMPELFGNERQLYASTFYHCSCSFVKYLAERVGVAPLIESIAAYRQEMEELQKNVSPSLEQLKKQWLIKINGR